MANEIQIVISAESVAWYAAIVGTFSMLASVFNAWRDRSNIKVTALPNYRVAGNGPYKKDTNYILITVANHGRRPVTITKAGLKMKGKVKPWILATDSFYKGQQKLTEGTSTDYLIEQELLKLDDIECPFAIDAVGKNYKGKIKLKK